MVQINPLWCQCGNKPDASGSLVLLAGAVRDPGYMLFINELLLSPVLFVCLDVYDTFYKKLFEFFSWPN